MAKEVASSLIHINEATAEDLQKLPGIGPKRAESLTRYRQQVAPISSVYDLAAATGLSLRVAETLGDKIQWSTSSAEQGKYASLQSILTVALAMSLPGLTILLTFFGETSELRGSSQWTAGINFLGFCLMMTSLHYSPALIVRFMFDDRVTKHLPVLMNVYDHSQYLAALPTLLVLLFHNSGLWIEEIFSAWITVLLFMNALELLNGRSTSIAMLPAGDQGGFRFIAQRHPQLVWFSADSRKPLGLISLVLGVVLTTALAATLSTSI